MLGSTWFKTIGTLFSGCVVGVVLACSWTGAADIDATLKYVNKLEVLIQQHAGNAEALLENLELQKEIYRQDVDVYYRAVQAANQETIKANEELEKANEAALNLRIAVENKYNKIVEDYPVMEVVPGVIKNPDVNHPDGEHDNGVGGAIQTPCGDVCPNPQCSNPTNCSKEKHNTIECCGAGHHKVPGTTNVHVSSGYIRSECMWDYGSN